MKKGDVVTVMTISGEFVGKVQSDDDLLVLDDPRLVVQGPEGQMGFARGICKTGVAVSYTHLLSHEKEYYIV